MKTKKFCLNSCMLLIALATAIACTSPSAKSEAAAQSEAANINRAKGQLFVIGGGPKPAVIMKTMAAAVVSAVPYGLVFTHASAEPDSAYLYFMQDMEPYTSMPLVNIANGTLRTTLIDSVVSAPFIFITGGDQNRFLEKVHPAIQRAIKDAYYAGAVVGGTSAGAALMSSMMITGDQRDWPLYESTFARLHKGNAIYNRGLGLLDSLIVDQHFITRSRYNRLLSALCDTGLPYAVGVDEETAFVVAPEACTVIGSNQVVVMHRPDSLLVRNARIGMYNMRMDVYLSGDTFNLKIQ